MPIRTKVLISASMLASLAFYFFRADLIPPLLYAMKGLPVALLALAALSATRETAGLLLAAVMALGAAGDIGVEVSLEAGAVLFLMGHLVAIMLYRRNRRGNPTASQKAAALALLVLVPLVAFSLPTERSSATGVAIYALGLGAMAASAWLSAYPRYRVGIGAVLFVISDLLIFARIGPLAGSPWPDLLIWPLYYTGQLLICVGIIARLQKPADYVITNV